MQTDNECTANRAIDPEAVTVWDDDRQCNVCGLCGSANIEPGYGLAMPANSNLQPGQRVLVEAEIATPLHSGNYDVFVKGYVGSALVLVTKEQIHPLPTGDGAKLPAGWTGPFEAHSDGSVWGRRQGRLCDFAIDCGEANAKCIAQVLNERFHQFPTGDGWQDIATAPKDEHVIVGKGDGMVRYSTVAKQHENGEWWELNNDPTDSWGDCLEPTHWQPLPPPPQQEGGKP